MFLFIYYFRKEKESEREMNSVFCNSIKLIGQIPILKSRIQTSLTTFIRTKKYWEVEYERRGQFSHDRCARGNHYKPNVMKRISTYGLSKRLETRGGKQMLWRKILQGKKGWINFVPAP
jgi:ribosomal protein L34